MLGEFGMLSPWRLLCRSGKRSTDLLLPRASIKTEPTEPYETTEGGRGVSRSTRDHSNHGTGPRPSSTSEANSPVDRSPDGLVRGRVGWARAIHVRVRTAGAGSTGPAPGATYCHTSCRVQAHKKRASPRMPFCMDRGEKFETHGWRRAFCWDACRVPLRADRLA